MKFIKYPGQQIINLENTISIDLGRHNKNSVEFDCIDNCFLWNFNTEEEAIKVYEKIINILRNRNSLIEIPEITP
jgi:hypothetical protein